ncbi:uncharacterized protein LOC110978775 isoform X2 [Acanthaster planci]|uniref:Uncharacterized protein LOC110978775 isoform X2 n=1 Tax=Acanthaster planci TaxID=133434 RepID=A0A8B7YBB5_ACAPL|nr:uncharacterized protein LOC110978775 isoform X2 [Acanthaster planci]
MTATSGTDHELVPFAIKDFWMIWGHELIKPLIFPVAKVIWDDEVQVEDSASGSLCWRALFNPLMTIDSEGGGKNERTGGMKALIQSIVRRLRGQVPDGDVDIQDRSCTPHLCRGVCFQQSLTKFAKPSSVPS